MFVFSCHRDVYITSSSADLHAACLSPDELGEVVRFIRCYGERPCCFSDVEPVLALVDGDQVASLLEQSRGAVELDDQGLPTTVCQGLGSYLLSSSLDPLMCLPKT